MEKRFQFFISSTFTDLKDERQAVLKAVLELSHMPAGMELFPASDETAWQLIRDVIDASDYYLLIIGGRYGSTDVDGIGYTEKEYDYAVQTRKPVIAFLHQHPGNIPREKTETDTIAWGKLEAFRKKIENHHTCVYWTSAEDLKAKVVLGITNSMKRKPAIGWVRADQVPSGSTLADVLALRNRVAELEAAEAASALVRPPGTEELAQGEDPFCIDVRFNAYPSGMFAERSNYGITACLTWNQIFAGVGPIMMNEAADRQLRDAVKKAFWIEGRRLFSGKAKFKNYETDDFRVPDRDVETCLVQLRALGLIQASVKQRSLRDSQAYWRLTPYGDHLMTQLRAIRRGKE